MESKADYPKVYVEYWERKPNTPQVSVPFKKYKYIDGAGVCEKAYKRFWTMEEAWEWVAQHPEALKATVHDTSKDVLPEIINIRNEPRRRFYRLR